MNVGPNLGTAERSGHTKEPGTDSKTRPVSGFVFLWEMKTMAKKVAVQDRKTAPVISMVPPKLREQVERLAEKGSVSISEIGRRALQEYVIQSGRAS